MKDIIIIGAGGFGREVKQLISDINRDNPSFNLLGFVDDGIIKGTMIHDLPVLGNTDYLKSLDESTSLAVAIGHPGTKKSIVKELGKFDFPSLIHPTVHPLGTNIRIGEGCILCRHTILTCDITLGDFVILNLACTVGHDAVIKSYSSFMPAVNISGEVTIEECVYVGTGAKIINSLDIGENATIGAGAVVNKSIPANTVAVGIPAKPLNK
jgi:sugar O-acyltransferase (sialic acid O-acetyltransferase NeuD family)